MPIDFPAAPTTNQTYTFAGYTWIWNGSAWDPYGTQIFTANNTWSGTNAFSAAVNVGTGTSGGTNTNGLSINGRDVEVMMIMGAM